MHLVPELLHPEIEASRYYARNSNSLVFQGTASRDQTINVDECYKKLHALIMAAGRSTVKGETMPGQVEKVKDLSVFLNASRLSIALAKSCPVQAAQRK